MLVLTALSHLGNRGGSSCLWEEEFFVEASVSTLFCNSETETVMHGHAHHGVGSVQAAGMDL